MVRRRVYEIIGTLIIGDGFAFLFAPRPHMLIWVDAMKLPLWRRLVQWFADHAPAARQLLSELGPLPLIIHRASPIFEDAGP